MLSLNPENAPCKFCNATNRLLNIIILIANRSDADIYPCH